MNLFFLAALSTSILPVQPSQPNLAAAVGRRAGPDRTCFRQRELDLVRGIAR